MLFHLKRLPALSLLGLLSCLSGCYGVPGPAGTVLGLEAEAILPIESELAIEPSGLCLRDGQLYSVSDDTDDMIFRLERSSGVAHFIPFLKFTPPQGATRRLDLEGIATGPDGSFFLLSEGYARILQVDAKGRASWVTDSVEEAGRAAGFFRARGGGLEGFTPLEPDGFLLLAERQPRGWFEMKGARLAASGKLAGTRFSRELALTRLPDFTGADTFGNAVYVLFRNGEMLTTLERTKNGWEEGPVAWSFAQYLRMPEWSYRDTRFGMAEGLAVDAHYFYVVIDNNGVARTASREDRRPLLLILKRR